MLYRFPLILMFGLLLSCATLPPAPEGATCASACERAAQLECSFAKTTKKGAGCVEVCKNAQKYMTWNLECRTKANTCDSIDRCEAP